METNKSEYIYIPADAQMDIQTVILVELYLFNNTWVKVSFSTHEEAIAAINRIPEPEKKLIKHIFISRAVETNRYTHSEIMNTLQELRNQACNSEKDIADIVFLKSKEPNAFIDINLMAHNGAASAQLINDSQKEGNKMKKWQTMLPHEQPSSYHMNLANTPLAPRLLLPRM